MDIEKLRKKFPGGIIRDRHPFYLFDTINEIPASLQACLAPEFLKQIRQAVKGVQPSLIYTLGCGTSLNAALAAAYFLQRTLKIPAYTFDAYDFEVDPPVVMDAHTLVIAISESGNSITTCLSVEYANEHGAYTVGISAFPESRLAKTAKLSLVDPAGHDVPLGKTRSYQTNTLSAILAGVLTQQDEIAEPILAKLAQIPASLAASTPLWQKKAQELAERLPASPTRHIVTGFGIQKPNADEIRLKLLEVLGESATSFGLEEFAHGPSATFREDVCVFIFQTDERTLQKALHFAKGVAISKANLIAITDQPTAGWPEKALLLPLAPLPEGGLYGGFGAAMAAQYLFYFLALHKGLNPDVNLEDIHPELGDIYSFYFPPGTH